MLFLTKNTQIQYKRMKQFAVKIIDYICIPYSRLFYVIISQCYGKRINPFSHCKLILVATLNTALTLNIGTSITE